MGEKTKSGRERHFESYFWFLSMALLAFHAHFWLFSRPFFFSRALFCDLQGFFTRRKLHVSETEAWFLCICPRKNWKSHIFRKFSRVKMLLTPTFLSTFRNFQGCPIFFLTKWENINFSLEPFVFHTKLNTVFEFFGHINIP